MEDASAVCAAAEARNEDVALQGRGRGGGDGRSATKAQRLRVRQQLVMREVLPDGFGIRTIIELRR